MTKIIGIITVTIIVVTIALLVVSYFINFVDTMIDSMKEENDNE